MSTGVVCAIEASSKRRTNPTPKQPIGALDVLSRNVLSRNEAAAGVTRKSHAGDNRGIPPSKNKRCGTPPPPPFHPQGSRNFTKGKPCGAEGDPHLPPDPKSVRGSSPHTCEEQSTNKLPP